MRNMYPKTEYYIKRKSDHKDKNIQSLVVCSSSKSYVFSLKQLSNSLTLDKRKRALRKGIAFTVLLDTLPHSKDLSFS